MNTEKFNLENCSVVGSGMQGYCPTRFDKSKGQLFVVLKNTENGEYYEHTVGTSQARFYNQLLDKKSQYNEDDLVKSLFIAQKQLIKAVGSPEDVEITPKDGKTTKGDVQIPSSMDVNQKLEDIAKDSMVSFLNDMVEKEIDQENNEERIEKLENLKSKLQRSSISKETTMKDEYAAI